MKRKNLILKKEIEIFKSDKHWKWILQTDILRIPKEEKKSKGTEKNSKNFKKYFLKLEKNFWSYILEEHTPYLRILTHKETPRYILVKSLDTKEKEKKKKSLGI